MKKITFLSLLAVLISCNKGKYPKITIETEFLPNGDLVVKGKIVGETEQTVINDVIGYSYATSPDDLSGPVQVCFQNSTSFIDTIPGQEIASNIYYFKAIGANDYGRGESEIISIGSSENQLTSPCGLPNNSCRVHWQTGSDQTSEISSPGFFWDSTSTIKTYYCQLFNGDYLEFKFKVVPTTGTYHIVNNVLTNNSSVVISNTNYQNYAQSGDVFIKKIDNTKFKVDFCDVPFYYGGYYNTSLSLVFMY